MGELNGTPIDALRLDACVPLNGFAHATTQKPLSNSAVVDPGDAAHAADRVRLEAEIAAAEARTSVARLRSTDVNSALHAIVVASKERLAAMERDHEVHVAEIRDRAQAEVARILDVARQQVGLGPSSPIPHELQRSTDGT